MNISTADELFAGCVIMIYFAAIVFVAILFEKVILPICPRTRGLICKLFGIDESDLEEEGGEW